MAFIRQGTCNRCGQCCGAEGSPNQLSPWPVNWPEAIYAWPFTVFESVMSQAGIVGLEADPTTEKVIKIDDYGQFNLKGTQYRWRWVPGHGLCKNQDPVADPDTYSLECPMLNDDEGDGRRECGLVGTKHEWMYTATCFPEGPERFETQAMLDQWETDHPLCSHTWVEE